MFMNRDRRERQTKGKLNAILYPTYLLTPCAPAKQRHKRSRANRYLDVEAEVDDEDEDEDEEDDFAGAGTSYTTLCHSNCTT
jgi:hypothetical protein